MPEYLTIAEAASRLGVHPNSIRNYIAAGRLSAKRVGPRLIRVDAAELEALLRPIPATHAA